MKSRGTVVCCAALAVISTSALVADAPPPAAAVAPTVAVGDPAVDGSFLRPYDNVWRYSVETVADHVVHFQALWTDHLQAVEKDGRHLLQRVQGVVYLDGRLASTVNVFDPKTLAPVASTQLSPDGSKFHREIAGAHVQFTKTAAPGGKEESGEADLGAPFFDFNGGMYGLLLAGFPLAQGYRATLSSIAEYEDRLQPVSFEVLRRERVAAGARGPVDAWVVQTGNMTFWLTKEPPYVLRLEIIGAMKNIARWDMI